MDMGHYASCLNTRIPTYLNPINFFETAGVLNTEAIATVRFHPLRRLTIDIATFLSFFMHLSFCVGNPLPRVDHPRLPEAAPLLRQGG